ncbi:MAG: hypothetical protein ABEI77_01615 [Halorientalis sp.]
MGFSTRLSRLPDALRGRLPDRPNSLPSPPSIPRPAVPIDLGDVRPDADVLPGVDDGAGAGDKLTLGLTVVTLLGLGLATVGVVGRLLLDRIRNRGDESAAESEDSDTEMTPDVLAVETDVEPPEDDETAGIERHDESEAAAVDVDEAETESEPTVLETEIPAPADEPSGESGAPREPPRIAPLVGMVGLIGMKLFVDKLGGETVDGN